jgi:hypothetical protein
MLSTIQRPVVAQVTAEQALVIARKRFPSLYATGILGAKRTGPPIELAQIERAMAFLALCRKSKVPAVHSFDLRQAIENVSVGATIAACVGLGFEVYSWLGVTDFAPHVMIGLNRADVARHSRIDRALNDSRTSTIIRVRP